MVLAALVQKGTELPKNSQCVAAALFVLCVPNLALGATYKCVEGGKTIYQATPCPGAGKAISVDPANGSVEPSPADDGTASRTPSSLTALRANVDAMARERRVREINHELDAYDREIAGYQSAMDAELNTLEQRKRAANNNLAGATWEQSLSMEMQAVTEKYKAKIQVAQDHASGLRKEAERLQQNAPKQ